MALPEPGEVLSSMQIPTSSLIRPAKMVKDTALGLRSPLSLRQLTQEVQNIRLQLCCSGLITGKILETPPAPQSDTFCLLGRGTSAEAGRSGCGGKDNEAVEGRSGPRCSQGKPTGVLWKHGWINLGKEFLSFMLGKLV